MKMPVGVEIRQGKTGERIRLSFNLNGRRCRETLNVPATDKNVEYAARKLATIQNMIARGTFVYSEFFPHSRVVRVHGAKMNALCETPQRARAISASKEKVGKHEVGDLRKTADRIVQSLDKLMKMPRFHPRHAHTGIYFLIKDEEIVYVGQSINVHARVNVHGLTAGKVPERSFDSYTYVSCPESSLDVLEATYIALLKPAWNVIAPLAASFQEMQLP